MKVKKKEHPPVLQAWDALVKTKDGKRQHVSVKGVKTYVEALTVFSQAEDFKEFIKYPLPMYS